MGSTLGPSDPLSSSSLSNGWVASEWQVTVYSQVWWYGHVVNRVFGNLSLVWFKVFSVLFQSFISFTSFFFFIIFSMFPCSSSWSPPASVLFFFHLFLLLSSSYSLLHFLLLISNFSFQLSSFFFSSSIISLYSTFLLLSLPLLFPLAIKSIHRSWVSRVSVCRGNELAVFQLQKMRQLRAVYPEKTVYTQQVGPGCCFGALALMLRFYFEVTIVKLTYLNT